MTWPEAIKDIVESLVALGIFLAFFTEFWDNLGRRLFGGKDDEE